MSRVFVVQNHLRYSPEIGQLVPRYDVSPALAFGDLEFILPSRATIDDPDYAIEVIEESLADFSDEDHLLLIGNPALIGWATTIAAANNNGRVSMLVWTNREKAYRAIKSVLPIRPAADR